MALIEMVQSSLKSPEQENTLTHVCKLPFNYFLPPVLVLQIKRPAGNPSALISCVVNPKNILDDPFHTQLTQIEIKVVVTSIQVMLLFPFPVA